MEKDIFAETGNPNDKPLGNDFLELDDPNGNSDFSQQENEIAADGYNQEKGNIDVENNTEPNEQTLSGFSNFDVADDDELDTDSFLTNEELQSLSSQAEEEIESEEDIDTSSANATEDQEFLNTMNKKFKTNFKTEKEFEDFMSKNNAQETEEENLVSDKDQQAYDSNKGSIGYLDKLVQKDDEDLMREHEIIRHFQKNKEKPTEEDMEMINDRIERMKDNMILSLTASNVRDKYLNQKNELESFNNKIDNKVQEAQLSKQKQKQKQLMNSYKDIYVSNEGKYMGVDFTTADLQATYNDVKSGEFVKRIMDDPKLAASLSLIERKLGAIQKATSQPGYSDGIEAVFNKGNSQGKRMGSNTRSRQTSSSTKSNSGDDAFLM